MAKVVRFQSATSDSNQLDALDVVLENEHKKTEWIAAEVTLTFASERWRKLVRRSHGLGNPTNRRHLGVCVFNRAGMTVVTNCETLPELVETIVDDMRETIARLRKWIIQLEPLVNLEPRH